MVAAVVDSGAVTSAMPPEDIPFVLVEPSPGSESGKHYRGAGGERIPNLGQKRIRITTNCNSVRMTKWQICPIRRPLMSVSDMNEAGDIAILSGSRPYVQNVETGEITPLRKEGKMFIIDLWVKLPEDFARQGQ